MTTLTTFPSIQLQWNQKDRKVLITPADEDRFMVTVENAINACDAFQKSIHFDKQFRDLMDYLGQWLFNHAELVDRAYLTVREADLLFIIVQRQKHYNRRLEDQLTDLDLEISHNDDFDLIRFCVLALPKTSEEGVSSFLNPHVTPLVYRNARRRRSR